MERASQRRLRPTWVGSGWGLGVGGQAWGLVHGDGFVDGPGLGDRQDRQTGRVRYTAGFADVQGFGHGGGFVDVQGFEQSSGFS